MKVYRVEYTEDTFIDGCLGNRRRWFTTKEKALKVFEEMKAVVIREANKKHKTDPDALIVSEYNDEELFVIYDEWNEWGVSISEVEVEE